MARGKKAAGAANRRAAAAADTVESLRAQLATEKAERAQEMTALKMRIEQLSGKLTSSLDDLARDAIQEGKEAADATIRAEREELYEKTKEIIEFLNEVTDMTLLQWVNLRDIAGPAFADAMKSSGVLNRHIIRNIQANRSGPLRLRENAKLQLMREATINALDADHSQGEQ